MARHIIRRVVSRLRRIALHSRFFCVTTNLRPGVQPFRTSEYRILVAALGGAREKLTFSLCGYCFMPDHVHAIIMPHEQTTISEVLRSFKVRSHPRLRRSRRRRGPFWQSRFYDHVLRTRGEFDEALEYIHMNPVVKGLVQDSFAWPWSSARWFVERQGPVEIDQMRLPSGPKSRI